MTDRSRRPTGFFRASVDGSNLERIEFEGMNGRYLSMNIAATTDGSRLAFLAEDENFNTQLFIANADGTNPQPITAALLDNQPYDTVAWSPDGLHTLLSVNPSFAPVPEPLMLADADGANAVALINPPPNYITSGSWSPDGSQITFLATEMSGDSVPDGEVYVANADGSGLRALNIEVNVGYFGTSWGIIPDDVILPTEPISFMAAIGADLLHGGYRAVITGGRTCERPSSSPNSTKPRLCTCGLFCNIPPMQHPHTVRCLAKIGCKPPEQRLQSVLLRPALVTSSALCALVTPSALCPSTVLSSIKFNYSAYRSITMSKKLYVGNLAFSSTEDQVRTLFTQAGEVESVSFIIDRETGRSRGFGFVEMATDEGAQEAIKRFNGYNLDKRPLTVNEARPREERTGGFGGGNRGGGNGNRNRY